MEPGRARLGMEWTNLPGACCCAVAEWTVAQCQLWRIPKRVPASSAWWPSLQVKTAPASAHSRARAVPARSDGIVFSWGAGTHCRAQSIMWRRGAGEVVSREFSVQRGLREEGMEGMRRNLAWECFGVVAGKTGMIEC